MFPKPQDLLLSVFVAMAFTLILDDNCKQHILNVCTLTIGITVLDMLSGVLDEIKKLWRYIKKKYFSDNDG